MTFSTTKRRVWRNFLPSMKYIVVFLGVVLGLQASLALIPPHISLRDLEYVVLKVPKEEGETVVALSETEKDTMAPKINWLPVWEDTEAHDIPKAIPQGGEQTTTMDKCEAPNKRGLKALLREALALMPLERIDKILKGAVNDPQVQALKHLLTSREYTALIQSIRESRDFHIFEDYVCSKMFLQLKDYERFVHAIFNTTALITYSGGILADQGAQQDAVTVAAVQRPSRSIRSLIEAIRLVLPKAELRDLYQRSMENDEYLVRAMANLHSTEFRRLARNLRKLPASRELQDRLVRVGVPLEDMKRLIDVALGWHYDELEGDMEEFMNL